MSAEYPVSQLEIYSDRVIYVAAQRRKATPLIIYVMIASVQLRLDISTDILSLCY